MIKKILYFILLAAELFIGTLLLMALWMNNNMVITCSVVIVAMVALWTWHIILFAKATDPTVKGKCLRSIALVALLPVAAFVAVYIYVAVGLIIAFS